MSGSDPAPILALARNAVLDTIRAADPAAPESPFDEDTLMRVVPLLEEMDPGRLAATLADENLPFEGRQTVHAYTHAMPAPPAGAQESR